VDVSVVLTRIFVVFFFLKPELHEILKLGLDVCKDGQTTQVAKATPLVGKFLRFNYIDL
jgi:hypothetical protein